jgi:hypothetical protein
VHRDAFNPLRADDAGDARCALPDGGVAVGVGAPGVGQRISRLLWGARSSRPTAQAERLVPLTCPSARPSQVVCVWRPVNVAAVLSSVVSARMIILP